MRIKLQTGDYKSEEQTLQLPADVRKYAGRDNHSIDDFNKAPHKTPGSYGFSVDASYDARLLGSNDFNTKLCANFDFQIYSDEWDYTYDVILDSFNPPFPGKSSAYDNNYVGQNYCFIIKNISNICATLQATNEYDPLVDIYSNRVTASYFQLYGSAELRLNKSPVFAPKLQIGWGVSNEVFIIADDTQRITINVNAKFRYPPAYNNGFYAQGRFFCDIYGHIVPKYNLPSEYIATNMKYNKNA